jgi:predicted MFS family arabinose efflux permease
VTGRYRNSPPEIAVPDASQPPLPRGDADVQEPYEKRWLTLGVIAMTVLLVILDATIVNIALPAVSADLGVDAATQQWIVTAYTLTFGGFLLLGGRIADFWGRKRTYLSLRRPWR